MGVYDPASRDSMSNIPQGVGYPVSGTFAVTTPAVTFDQPATATVSELDCMTTYTVTRTTTDISNALNVGVSVDGNYDGGTGSGNVTACVDCVLGK